MTQISSFLFPRSISSNAINVKDTFGSNPTSQILVAKNVDIGNFNFRDIFQLSLNEGPTRPFGKPYQAFFTFEYSTNTLPDLAIEDLRALSNFGFVRSNSTAVRLFYNGADDAASNTTGYAVGKVLEGSTGIGGPPSYQLQTIFSLQSLFPNLSLSLAHSSAVQRFGA